MYLTCHHSNPVVQMIDYGLADFREVFGAGYVMGKRTLIHNEPHHAQPPQHATSMNQAHGQPQAVAGEGRPAGHVPIRGNKGIEKRSDAVPSGHKGTKFFPTPANLLPQVSLPVCHDKFGPALCLLCHSQLELAVTHEDSMLLSEYKHTGVQGCFSFVSFINLPAYCAVYVSGPLSMMLIGLNALGRCRLLSDCTATSGDARGMCMLCCGTCNGQTLYFVINYTCLLCIVSPSLALELAWV